VTLASTSS
jgi:hypothetical protein